MAACQKEHRFDQNQSLFTLFLPMLLATHELGNNQLFYCILVRVKYISGTLNIEVNLVYLRISYRVSF